jgi:hypothetical protein
LELFSILSGHHSWHDFPCRTHPKRMFPVNHLLSHVLFQIDLQFPGWRSINKRPHVIVIASPRKIQTPGPYLHLTATQGKRNRQNPIVMTFGKYLELLRGDKMLSAQIPILAFMYGRFEIDSQNRS